jgi:DNA-binding transcriptional regulator YiaG
MTPKQLKEARRRLGCLTQKELAEKLGVHWRTVQKWEGGERQPRGPVLALLRLLLERVKEK